MTQQDRQLKKVKLYRALKVVFYCLGLPLFVTATFLASVRFIGSDPFNGNTLFAQQLGMFYDINKLFTSPALYGVWIAFAIWLVIAIVHIILAKTVKSRRVRALSVTALTLVVMLGCLFGMDAVLGAKVDRIAADAPASVTVQDYKTLLSYYRTLSSFAHKKNLTENLIDQVEFLERVYHIEWEGVDKTGVAGSIGNKPVTYYNIIADDGTVGIDISYKTVGGQAELDYSGSNGSYTFKGKDGITRNIEGNRVVTLAPAGDGSLTINGKTYSHYFAQERTAPVGGSTYTMYTWYCKDMESTSWRADDEKAQAKYRENGVYGEGLYNQNGLLSDGWIFSFENVLEILEDYYEAKDAIENGSPANYGPEAYAKIYNDAVKRRENYYNNNNADPWLKALYNQEVIIFDETGATDNEKRFTLTRGELDELIAKVGALLGDNSLFDYLFGHIDEILDGFGDGNGNNPINSIVGKVPFLGGGLGAFLTQLSNGLPISTLLSAFNVDTGIITTVADILSALTGKTYDYVDDLILNLSYKTNDAFGVKHDNLYLAVIRGVGEWQFAEGGEALPLTRTGKDAWVYTDGEEEFTATVTDGKTYDKDGKEIKFVISAAGDPENIYLDIDFNDELIGQEQVIDPVTGKPVTNNKYAFDFDTLSAFLNKGLNGLLDKYLGQSTTDTVAGLITNTIKILKPIEVGSKTYYGFSVIGIEIPILTKDGNSFKVDIDINGILTNFLKTLYSYQSAVIKPVWEFYTNESFTNKQSQTYLAQLNYQRYERALYTATIYGSMIGSTLLGDSLGTGAYSSSLGLTDLASVQQLKVDLSYQRVFFPLFAVRDMIALFAGVVIMFYFISFIAAQREEDYATGKLTVRRRKADKDAEKHEAEIIAEFDANGDNIAQNNDVEEGSAVKSDENPDAQLSEDKPEGAGEELNADEPAEEIKADETAAETVADEIAEEPASDDTVISQSDEVAETTEETVIEESVSDGRATEQGDEAAAEEVKADEVAEPATEESVAEESAPSSEEQAASESGEATEPVAEEPIVEPIEGETADSQSNEAAEEPIQEEVKEDPAVPVDQDSDEEVL